MVGSALLTRSDHPDTMRHKTEGKPGRRVTESTGCRPVPSNTSTKGKVIGREAILGGGLMVSMTPAMGVGTRYWTLVTR